MNVTEIIARNVKNEMSARKLTTVELGVMSGTSQSFISRLARGVHPPTIERLDQIRKSLDLTWEELLEE